MYPCPSCQEPTISFWRKWRSRREAPVRCEKCGRSCAIASVDAGGIVVVCTVVATLFGFGAVAFHSATPFVGGLGLAAAIYFWRLHKALLIPISESETNAAKRSSWTMVVLSLFTTLFN